jgi:hypothetical protein
MNRLLDLHKMSSSAQHEHLLQGMPDTERSSTYCSLRCRACHVDDPEHKTVFCPKPCARLHHPCEHRCRKECGHPCGTCTEAIPTVALPCGHTAINEPCYRYHTCFLLPHTVMSYHIVGGTVGSVSEAKVILSARS